MANVHWNRITIMRQVIVWVLVAGLTTGGALWAQPMPNAQGPNTQGPNTQGPDGQRPADQRPDAQKADQRPDAQKADQKKDTQKTGGQKSAAPKGGTPYPTIGRISQNIPGSYDVVRSGPNEYFFHAGIFYTRAPKGFKVASPPRGCVVKGLPVGFETLIIAGITYFVYAGVYYNRATTGYVVVDAPAQTVVVQETAAGAGNALTVNVDRLNVRSGPGTNHSVVSQVRGGDTLTVQGTSGEWYYVQLPDGTYGWVMSRYTRAMFPDAKG